MMATDWIQAIATVVLVGVTILYVWQTHRMAKEMQLQRLAAKPVLIPDINVRFDQTFDEYTEKMRDLAQGDFPVILTNVGTEAAIEIELSLKPPSKKAISVKLPLLLPGGSWKKELTYISEYDDAGDPIYGLPPPEGGYEIKVAFRSANSSQLFEVTLPFDLHCTKGGAFWQIKRSKLSYKLSEVR